MRTGGDGEAREDGHVLQDRLGVARVPLHELVLGVGEAAWLVEDRVGDAQLADVVQEAGAAQVAQLGGAEAELAADADRVCGDAVGVARGVGALGVDHRGKRLGDAVDAGIVGRDEAAVGGRRREPLARQVGEERVRVWQRQERICNRGIEPAPAAHAHHVARGLEAVLGDEHVGRLRQAGDAGEDRDRVAAQPVGLAAAVPVLVEVADGVGGGIGELEHGHDAGAAVAARLDGQIALARHVAQGGQHPPRPHEARVVAARLAGDEPDGVARARPVDALGDPLQLEVVGSEDLGHAGGRRRAARVLQQHGVVEARALLGGEGQRLGQAQCDQAAALRVPGRLALGQVERVGERGDDLAHREGLRGRVGRRTKMCRHHRGYRPRPAPVDPTTSRCRGRPGYRPQAVTAAPSVKTRPPAIAGWPAVGVAEAKSTRPVRASSASSVSSSTP